MSTTIILPTPVASSSITVGQLLLDPLNPDFDSFINPNDSLPLRAPSVQSHYKESVSQDDNGRFTPNTLSSTYSSRENTVLVEADEMSYITLRDSLAAFRYISRRATSQSYLHKMALRRQPLYFVTGLKKLMNPSFKSTSSLRQFQSRLVSETPTEDVIFAIEMRKVVSRVGSPEEPQGPADMAYSWKHYQLQGENDLQLAVGLGRPVEAAEFRAFAGISSGSDYTDESAESSDFDFDDDEGPCCSSCISNAAYR